MVLGDRTTRKITVRGQEYRWAVIGRSESSGQPNACQCKQCRVLSLIVEKRLLPPSHTSRAYQKSSSAHPSRRRSIQLTVKLGHQLPWIGWCPSREDLERHMLPRQFQLLYGFVRIRFDLQSIPTLRQLAIDAIFNAYTTMEALPLRPSELPGRQAVPVTRKSLRSSVFPVDRATGLPDIRGFKWDKKRQPKDPRLFSLTDSPLFSSFIGERFSLQTLSVVHSKWCYAKQIRPSQVANLIEKPHWTTDIGRPTLLTSLWHTNLIANNHILWLGRPRISRFGSPIVRSISPQQTTSTILISFAPVLYLRKKLNSITLSIR